MANINEVNTGSINDVANTLQSDVMQPIDIVNFSANNEAATEEKVVDYVAPATPAEQPPVVEPTIPPVTPTPINVEPVEEAAPTPVNFDSIPPIDTPPTPVVPFVGEQYPILL